VYNMIVALPGGPLPGSTSDTDRIKYCGSVAPVLLGGEPDRALDMGKILKYEHFFWSEADIHF
jgi:hypothetical protein